MDPHIWVGIRARPGQAISINTGKAGRVEPEQTETKRNIRNQGLSLGRNESNPGKKQEYSRFFFETGLVFYEFDLGS